MIKNLKQKLEYFKWYDVNESEKIAFIEKLYKLAYINYHNFMQKNWQNLDKA
jgi:hypothetical protein